MHSRENKRHQYLRIIKVFLGQDYSTIGTYLVLFRCRVRRSSAAGLALCLSISSSLGWGFRKRCVVLATNLVLCRVDLYGSWFSTRIRDSLRRDSHVFHLVTVKEVGNVHPPCLISFDLLTEKAVSRQIVVWQVVLNLLFNRGVRGSWCFFNHFLFCACFSLFY